MKKIICQTFAYKYRQMRHMLKDNSIYWRSCFRMILIFLLEYLYLRGKRKEQICFQSGSLGITVFYTVWMNYCGMATCSISYRQMKQTGLWKGKKCRCLITRHFGKQSSMLSCITNGRREMSR